jgi:hypothetical protein
MHTEGILVFRSANPTAPAQQQWYAVFRDGSFVVATGSGSCILRCNDGSTCEKTQGTNREGSGENSSGDASMDWISTMRDGKRCGISLSGAGEGKLETAKSISAKV